MARRESFKDAAKRYKLSAEQLNGEIKGALNKIGMKIVADCKRNTPVLSGHMRRSWSLSPAQKQGDTIKAEVLNGAEYSFYVNNGHRQGSNWVRGSFMVENALSRIMPEFEGEMHERVQRLIETGRAQDGGV